MDPRVAAAIDSLKGGDVKKLNRGLRGGIVLGGLAFCLLLGGCISIDVFGDAADGPLAETVVRGSEGPKILLLDIDGVIGGAEAVSSFFGFEETSMVARVRQVLDRARADEEVRGVLLRIDSPGGTATASEQVYTEVMRFKAEREVPVVAQLMTTAASGGYYIAMAADTVQAHPTTVTGSIGVIFSSVNFVGLMEKIGVEDQTVTGGDFKDAGSPYRRLTGEEREHLQSIVDDLHTRFRDAVDLGRPNLNSEQVGELANGRVYSAQQALANGLVDRLGTLEDAVVLLESEIGAPTSRVVAYHAPRDRRRNLYTRSSGRVPIAAAGFGTNASATGVDMAALAAVGLREILGRPGFQYLWWPGLLSAQSSDW
jgi:protease IV